MYACQLSIYRYFKFENLWLVSLMIFSIRKSNGGMLRQSYQSVNLERTLKACLLFANFPEQYESYEYAYLILNHTLIYFYITASNNVSKNSMQ